MEAVLFGLVATPIVYGLLRGLAVVLASVLDLEPARGAGPKTPTLEPDPYDIAPCFAVTYGPERVAIP